MTRATFDRVHTGASPRAFGLAARALLTGLLGMAVGFTSDAGAAAEAASGDGATAPAHAATGRQAHSRAPVAALDDRVQLMAKELDLDASQQAALKVILVVQGAEVSKVWSDASVPAAVRVGATQAISERTAERIRALLTDEQRAKYMKAHRHDAPVGAPGDGVQKWMDKAEGRSQPQASAVAPPPAKEN